MNREKIYKKEIEDALEDGEIEYAEQISEGFKEELKLKQLLEEAYEHGANELEKNRFEDWIKEKLEDLK